MLAEQTTSGFMVETLPQLKVVMRDRPHATRRNLSRNWKADPFLDEVANAFLFAADSPVRMIQYSHIFRDWLCENIRRQNPDLSCVQVNNHVKNLNFAPHRFESTAAPLTRVVLFFPAFLQTVSKIALQRKAEDAGKSAAKFLSWLDYERCVQLAMLGDCAIENLELTRLVDFEGFPVEDFPGQLISFRARIRSLFTGDAPACLDTGLTRHMLKILGKRTMAFSIPSSRGVDVVQFTPTDERTAALTVGKCLSRMSGWVALTERTLEAEFPHFETQQSFKIFSLSAAAERPNGSHFCRSKDLSRLLKAYRLPEPDLQANIADQASRLWYVARRTAMEEKLNSVDCWISAVKQTTRTNTPQTRSSVAAVLPILVRYWAAGASTSGVEQAFSRSQQLTDNLMIDGHIDDVLEASLVIDIPPAELQIIARKAAAVWLQVYGATRISGSAHRAKGVKRMVEEVRAGRGAGLLDSLGMDDLQLVLDGLQKKAKTDSEYVRDRARKNALAAPPTSPDLEAAPVHVSEALRDSADIQQALQRKHAVVVCLEDESARKSLLRDAFPVLVISAFRLLNL
ncbi:unnamed protein product [Symbiodinium sp. CCMP2456]|nr:unnamed protein product [Symbiodinium sp. CCMP2456]